MFRLAGSLLLSRVPASQRAVLTVPSEPMEYFVRCPVQVGSVPAGWKEAS